MKILLIEDNPGDARLIREMLSEVKDFSFDLEWCDRLSCGLASLERESVEVILLDLTLPDSDGLDTFDQVSHHAQGVPIIVLTILTNEMTGLEAVEKGAQDYLFKGQVDGHLLVRSIRYATGRKQVEEALWVSHRFLEISNRNTEMAPLLREYVGEIRQFTGCEAVGIRILSNEGTIPYQAGEGFSPDFYQSKSLLSIKTDQCLCTKIIKGERHLPFSTENGSFFLNHASRSLAEMSEKERKQNLIICTQEGHESIALVPVLVTERILGIIHVADHREDMVPLRKVRILEKAALQLGTAIQRVYLEETRRKNERALRESEERYRSFVQNFHGIAYRSDMSLTPLFVHGNVEAITGYTENEFIVGHMRWDQIIHPDDVSRIYEDSEQIRSKPGYSGEREYRIIRKNGQVRWIHENVQNICDHAGNPVLVQGAMYDITERKWVEEELQKYRFHLEDLVKERTMQLTAANERLRQEITERKQAERAVRLAYAELDQIFNVSVDGMCVISKDLTVLRVNETFCALFGLNREEATGRNCNEVFLHDLCHSLSCPLSLILGGENSFESDLEIEQKDGRKISCILTAIPFYSPDGELIGIVENLRDITERKRMEDELQKVQRLESLGVLAGGIAHDFNNILGSVIGSFSLLKLHARKEEKFSGLLARAEKAALQAKDLTQQLLTFSKGGGAPAKKTISISKTLDDAVCFALRGSRVRAEFSIPDTLWPVEVDEGQICQVFNNLIINAIEAMPQGGIVGIHAENAVINTGRASESLPLKEGRYVKISIHDQGVGILKEHLQRIFDPYFTTKKTGTGLGLANSYTIIKKHGGYITAESEPGAGTTFHIYLPASNKEFFVVKDIVDEGLLPGHGKILFMDDQKSIREMVGEMLVDLGYEVEFAREGSEAIKLYQEAKKAGHPFDAVILDLTVPGGMGGQETIDRLRETDPKIKAIVSSGYSNDPVIAGYQEYGFCGAIGKPYEIKELARVLSRTLMGTEPKSSS
ncbi:MAG: PAS domain S-box protein [bacterium]